MRFLRQGLQSQVEPQRPSENPHGRDAARLRSVRKGFHPSARAALAQKHAPETGVGGANEREGNGRGGDYGNCHFRASGRGVYSC